MYCTVCGKEISDNAVVCVHCGCIVKKTINESPIPEKNTTGHQTQISVILGIIGIVGAWLFALIGHVSSIAGMVIGWNEYKKSGNSLGFTLSFIGEACSVISSIIGVVIITGF